MLETRAFVVISFTSERCDTPLGYLQEIFRTGISLDAPVQELYKLITTIQVSKASPQTPAQTPTPWLFSPSSLFSCISPTAAVRRKQGALSPPWDCGWCYRPCWPLPIPSSPPTASPAMATPAWCSTALFAFPLLAEAEQVLLSHFGCHSWRNVHQEQK